MKMKVGTDLVYIPNFQHSIDTAGQKFLEKLFTEAELTDGIKTETLAGMFAAKEAFIKAYGLPLNSWHDVKVLKEKTGRPYIKTSLKSVGEVDISISHDNDYAIAVVIIEDLLR